MIQIADDSICERTEYFRLQIVDIRFIGQAANLVRAPDGVNNTFVDVHIEDNDCTCKGSACN